MGRDKAVTVPSEPIWVFKSMSYNALSHFYGSRGRHHAMTIQVAQGAMFGDYTTKMYRPSLDLNGFVPMVWG
jgi:hypothetical protein